MRKRVNEEREQKVWCYGLDLSILEILTHDGERWQFVQRLVDDKIGDCFLVSSTGRVFDCDKREFRQQYLDNNENGYLLVSLPQSPQGFKNYKTHRLVALAFVFNPNPENRIEVHHINCIETDNHAINLLWVSRREHKMLHILKETDELRYWERIAELRKEQPIKIIGTPLALEVFEDEEHVEDVE